MNAVPVLRSTGLKKSFGMVKAVRGLDLEVPPGSVYGILGPNGSGKSTTLSMLLGILRPDEGDFRWFGEPGSPSVRRRIGAMLEQPNFYPYLSARRNLRVACGIKGVPYARIDEVLEQVYLLPRAESAFQTFSTGMKQRLAIASALLADPEVLVLDEPTNGLDPQGIAEVRTLITEIAGRGKTILLASHILDEVEKVCTHVAVIKQGQLLAQGAVATILTDQHQVELQAPDTEALRAALSDYAPAAGLTAEGDVLLLAVNGEPDPAGINRHCFDRGVALTRLRVRKKSLEESFLEITGRHG
jgi:ABC-type multidrug transport system ATPase subunit